jgi:8-oxo-dGTP diphosphatase
MAGPRLLLVAACALINDERRVLIAQRPAGKTMAGLWEFPGGKVEAGERPEEAVIREMREELAVSIEESSLIPFTFASHGYPKFHLLMPLFLCRRWAGAISPREGQNVAWVKPDELDRYPMPPADAPLIPRLRDLT